VKTSKLVGLAAIGLIVAGLFSVLPDIRRYIRISTM
jgi:hypothetical protein